MSVFEAFCIICHNNTKRKNKEVIMIHNKRSKVLYDNDLYKKKTVLLLTKMHDDEKIIYLYTLTYIDFKELANKEKRIVFQSD